MNVMLILGQCTVIVVTCEMTETRPVYLRRSDVYGHTRRLTLEDDDQN